MKNQLWVWISLLLITACTVPNGQNSGELKNHSIHCEEETDGGVCAGTIDSIKGTASAMYDPPFSGDVNYHLTISVEAGEVELWLMDPQGERASVLVTPVTPGVLNGTTPSARSSAGTSEFEIFFKAAGEEATGISYSLNFAKP